MYRLVRANVVKIVDSKHEKDKLIHKGYKVVEVKDKDNFDDMKVDELKDIAKQKGLEGYSKLKRNELIELLR